MRGEARPVTACRSCGGSLGATFCDLGRMPLANSYLPPGADLEAEPSFPLRAVVCDECRMVQLDAVVDAQGIFSDYAYFSSTSESWLEHARRYSAEMMRRLGLNSRSLVIEAASNDGYLLRNFVAAGVPCLGVEPAANIAWVARESGVPTETAFLGADSADDLLARLGRHADLVIANNVLAHVPDVNDFVAGLARLAGPQGMVSIEAPHLLRMVEGVQFDTIYHEHYAYWSFLAMERLLARHGLHVARVEELPTHGGSLRVLACARAASSSPGSALAMRELELRRGLGGDAFYRGFDQRVRLALDDFQSWMSQSREQGLRVAAYGAAAKGNTFLNAAGVKADGILAVADRNPVKQGRLLPGSHIPVVSPEELMALAPDDILILPWNIAREIVKSLRGAGFRGRLLTAVPRMEVR
ncbi:class I SAM-dependent methyltransferase [Desulfomicrobium baculatum]|uniref:C-methyltransferase n=1 Tax=Desulfomicrobium baculatum (strain DSM 4028 / VKM B-1378 / X) TaxID=525897 RepID=C7LWS9_DESBD|nr:class I SAM-dependent methyltransferase [Desulfomicrobium baculatum]ACU89962.1 C-methyltransferase [Desulfomicrobium baculatum DSM 4028]